MKSCMSNDICLTNRQKASLITKNTEVFISILLQHFSDLLSYQLLHQLHCGIPFYYYYIGVLGSKQYLYND